jgi:hypothetical protein
MGVITLEGVLKEAGAAYPVQSVFEGVNIAHIFSFLCLFGLSSSCALCVHCCHGLWIVHS